MAEFRSSASGGDPHALIDLSAVTESRLSGPKVRWQCRHRFLRGSLIRTVAALKTPQGFLYRNRPVYDTSRVQLGLLLARPLLIGVVLTLSVFALVRLPPWVVEPVIAVSIIFVAMENILWPRRIQREIGEERFA